MTHCRDRRTRVHRSSSGFTSYTEMPLLWASPMQHWLNLNTNSTEGSYVTDHTHTQMLAVQGAVNACSTLNNTLLPPAQAQGTVSRPYCVSLPPSVRQTLLRLIVHNHMGGTSLALLMHHFNLWDTQAHLVIRQRLPQIFMG